MNFTDIFKDNSAYLLHKIVQNKNIFHYAPIIAVEFCKQKLFNETAIKVVFAGHLNSKKIYCIQKEKYFCSWSYENDTTEITFMVLKTVCPFVDYYLTKGSEPIVSDLINTINYFVCMCDNEKGGSSLCYNPLRCF